MQSKELAITIRVVFKVSSSIIGKGKGIITSRKQILPFFLHVK
jgi:hypothetical protein